MFSMDFPRFYYFMLKLIHSSSPDSVSGSDTSFEWFFGRSEESPRINKMALKKWNATATFPAPNFSRSPSLQLFGPLNLVRSTRGPINHGSYEGKHGRLGLVTRGGCVCRGLADILMGLEECPGGQGKVGRGAADKGRTAGEERTFSRVQG